MKASIISTIIATLLAASSAVQFPVSTHCQLEIPATFTAPDGVTSFTQTFPADNQWYPIRKSIKYFFFFATYRLKKGREFQPLTNFPLQKNFYPSHIFRSPKRVPFAYSLGRLMAALPPFSIPPKQPLFAIPSPRLLGSVNLNNLVMAFFSRL
jgi:hypothetical protein